jgi:hypothetical protein
MGSLSQRAVVARNENARGLSAIASSAKADADHRLSKVVITSFRSRRVEDNALPMAPLVIRDWDYLWLLKLSSIN